MCDNPGNLGPNFSSFSPRSGFEPEILIMSLTMVGLRTFEFSVIMTTWILSRKSARQRIGYVDEL